jgi:uncharacterized protein DUF4157
MKAVQANTAVSPAKSNSAFFSKEGSNGLFSQKTGDKFFNKSNRNAPFIQKKLTVGQPNDKYEKEADAMADKVVQRLSNNSDVSSKKESVIQAKPVISSGNTITPFVQTKCASCEQEEKLQKKGEEAETHEEQIQKKPIFESNAEPPDGEKNIQRKCAECEKEEKLQKKSDALSPQTASPDIESSLNSSKGSGDPLPAATRHQMENSFGADFSDVRIHNNSSATQMSRDLNAQAFTHGSDIYFNSGKLDTNSNSGKHLLAHELTHVVQQDAGKISRNKIPQGKIYKKPILTKPPAAKILVNWNFQMPKVPSPDYSVGMDALDAWEIAILIPKPAFTSQIESVNPHKDDYSFLKELSVDINPNLEYFIAKELHELATKGGTLKPIKGMTIPEDATPEFIKHCFTRLVGIINTHASEHFHRYGLVIDTFQNEFTKAVQNLPSSKDPFSITKKELEDYLTDFMLYQMSLLSYKLWDDACKWEREDYPKLMKQTNCLGGEFKVKCPNAPKVSDPPAILIKGKR